MYLAQHLSFYKGHTAVSSDSHSDLGVWRSPAHQDPPPSSLLPVRLLDMAAHISPLTLASSLVFQVTPWTLRLRILMKILG